MIWHWKNTTLLSIGLLILGLIIVASSSRPTHVSPRLELLPPPEVKNWPWFEDPYFNLKFQYPPEWRVEKVDVMDNHDASELSLAGEDAAVAGPHLYKTWILRIEPPYEDIQAINRGVIGIVHSAIVIEQPDRFNGNNHFYSDVMRSKDREYEAVLDPYGEGFRFNFTDYATFGNGVATTSLSFGHSPDGRIAGVTALKRFPHGYHFQPYMTMTQSLGHTEGNLFAFTLITASMQLLFPEEQYDETKYKIPISP